MVKTADQNADLVGTLVPSAYFVDRDENVSGKLLSVRQKGRLDC